MDIACLLDSFLIEKWFISQKQREKTGFQHIMELNYLSNSTVINASARLSRLLILLLCKIDSYNSMENSYFRHLKGVSIQQ